LTNPSELSFFLLYVGRIYNQFHVTRCSHRGSRITRATAHLRLLRQGKASLLSLQREFLNNVWGGLPLLALFPTSSFCTSSLPLSLSLSFFLCLSLLSVPLGALTLSSSRVSFQRFTRQLQSTTPPTGSLLGVYISGVFIRDWTFFVLVLASRGARLSKKLRTDECQYGARDVWYEKPSLNRTRQVPVRRDFS